MINLYVHNLINILKEYEQDDEVKVSVLVDLNSIDEIDRERGYVIIDADVIDFDGSEYPTIMSQDINYK